MWNLKNLILLFCLSTLTGFAQSWQSKIDRINNYTKNYDPYKRIFTYEPSSNKLKWITDDGDIICEAVLTDIKVASDPGKSGANSYVTFTCKEKSKCIACSYGGPYVETTSITVTDAEIAGKIVDEILSINTTTSTVTKTNTVSWQAIIDKVNNFTKLFDPYKRSFSYEPTSGKLSWITNDKDITCKVYVKDVNIYAEPGSGSDSYVSFSCKDGSKCVSSDYSGALKLTSITITNKDIADKIVTELKKLDISESVSTTTIAEMSEQSDFKSLIDKINKLCVSNDPYIRHFSYNKKTDILTWINKDGDITCKVKLKEINVIAVSNKSDYSVQFKCKSGDKCVDCNYGGATSMSSITLTTRSAADNIVEYIETIKDSL